jgi:hypothetical protein
MSVERLSRRQLHQARTEQVNGRFGPRRRQLGRLARVLTWLGVQL